MTNFPVGGTQEPMSFVQDGQRTEKYGVCMHCGAKVELKKCWYINYDNARSEFIAPEAEPTHGQYGVLPIGTGCARTLVKSGQLKAKWIITE